MNAIQRDQNKWGDDWSLCLDESKFSVENRPVLDGMRGHISWCYKTMYYFFGVHPGDVDEFSDLFESVCRDTSPADNLVSVLGKDASIESAVSALRSVLISSCMNMFWSLEALLSSRVGEAVVFHSQSVADMALFDSYSELVLSRDRSASGRFDPSTFGKKGAAARHAPHKELKDFTIKLYRGGKWASKLQAAKRLMPKVIDEGKRIGWTPSADNAERTVYGWILKDK